MVPALMCRLPAHSELMSAPFTDWLRLTMCQITNSSFKPIARIVGMCGDKHDLNAGMQAVDPTDRDAWARSMRARFSPPAMLNDDASVNQDYFGPRQA